MTVLPVSGQMISLVQLLNIKEVIFSKDQLGGLLGCPLVRMLEQAFLAMELIALPEKFGVNQRSRAPSLATFAWIAQ